MLSGAKFWNSLVQDKIKFLDNLIFKNSGRHSRNDENKRCSYKKKFAHLKEINIEGIGELLYA